MDDKNSYLLTYVNGIITGVSLFGVALAILMVQGHVHFYQDRMLCIW